MKQWKKDTSFLSHKAYYIALFTGFALLAVLMVIYSQQMKNRNEASNQEISLDEVGNQAIQKTEATTEAVTETETEHTQNTVVQETGASAFSYDGKTKLEWPVNGNVILPFSMDTTVYFETLDQYKCNPGILIEAKEGQGVGAITKCKVEEVVESDEFGNEVVLDLGNEYTVIMGQLKDIKVKQGDTLESGDTIGYVAEPTDCYTLEGCHLYMEMLEKDTPVNPVDYLKEE